MSPYLLELIDGCLHSGRVCANHEIYCVDLAGEPHFINTTIDNFVNKSHFPILFPTELTLGKSYDYQAYKNNAILIPCCGFDSVPADAVIHLANKTAKSVLGPSGYLEDSISLYNFKGVISGGTLALAISSVDGAMKNFSYRERERILPTVQPHISYANSAKAKGAPRKPTGSIYSVSIDGKTGYGGIFPMCPINRLVVHPTWSLFKRSQDRRPEKFTAKTSRMVRFLRNQVFIKRYRVSLDFRRSSLVCYSHL